MKAGITAGMKAGTKAGAVARTATRRPQQGVALVELALVLPLLLLLCMVTAELGRAFWHYKLLVQSVREAARYLAAQKPGEGAAEARNLILYGRLSASGTHQLAYLTAAQTVQIDWQRDAQTGMAWVTVGLPSYRFDSMLVSWAGVELGRITFGPIAAKQRIASCGTVC